MPHITRITLSILALPLIHCACGDGGDNRSSSGPSASFSVSGTLNGSPVEIPPGFCKTLALPGGDFLIFIGENPVKPTGTLLTFSSRAALHEGTYVLPHPDLHAGYDATTPASSGTVTITNVAIASGQLTALGGSATLFFSGQTTGELHTTFSCMF